MQLGYTPADLSAAPYDWRLPPRQLAARDDYFFRLMQQVETAVAAKRRAQARWHNRRHQRRRDRSGDSSGGSDGGDGAGDGSDHGARDDPRAILLAHSMGNSVVRYFVAWLGVELGSAAAAAEWCRAHVRTLVGVGPPLLGAANAIEMVMSGVRNGLPVSDLDARRLVSTWGASLWMMPTAASPPFLKSGGEIDAPLVALEQQGVRGGVAAGGRAGAPPLPAGGKSLLSHDGQDSLADGGGSGDDTQGSGPKRTIRSNYSEGDIASGALLSALQHTDTADGAAAKMAAMLRRFYTEDPLVNVLAGPPARPPFPKVVTAYGVGLPTPVAYSYRATRQAGAADDEGSTPSSSPPPAASSATAASAPSQAWEWDRLHTIHEGMGDGASVGGGGGSGGFGGFGFGGNSGGGGAARTACEEAEAWKVENGVLRVRDSDCGWDYLQARCHPPGVCVYSYRFGDVHLGQSCRLAASAAVLDGDDDDKKERKDGKEGTCEESGESGAAAAGESGRMAAGAREGVQKAWPGGTARQRPSGDNTVPYTSLAWAHTWLGGGGNGSWPCSSDKAVEDPAPADSGASTVPSSYLYGINITAVPQIVYMTARETSSRVVPPAVAAARTTHEPLAAPTLPLPQVSFFESVVYPAGEGDDASAQQQQSSVGSVSGSDTEKDSGAKEPRAAATAVWELEGVGHREILGNGAFLRELVAELRHEMEGGTEASTTFASKARRPPRTDQECDWDYALASCKYLQHCVYSFKFGDVHLGQSCRLKM